MRDQEAGFRHELASLISFRDREDPHDPAERDHEPSQPEPQCSHIAFWESHLGPYLRGTADDVQIPMA